MSALRFCLNSTLLCTTATIFTQTPIFSPKNGAFLPQSVLRNPRNLCYLVNDIGVASHSTPCPSDSPLSGLDDVLMGYVSGKKKAIEVAHLVWRRFVHKGDIVVDATCGNGYYTLEMLNLVKDDMGGGCVYGMDIQENAIKNTSSLLKMSLNQVEERSVKLLQCCHSKMAEVLPKGIFVRLVAFNLGYLPGGDKALATKPNTTLLALEAAKQLLGPGGLISVVAYVGHPGGREEYETVCSFACGLSSENWACSQIQMLNRPLSPVLLFLSKK